MPANECGRSLCRWPIPVSYTHLDVYKRQALNGAFQDITERKQSDQRANQLLQAVEHSPVSIVITDKDGSIEYVNAAFSEFTGYCRDEAIGQNPRILKSGETPAAGYDELWRTLRAGKNWKGVFHNRKKNGELFWESATISPIFNAQREVTHYLAVKEDISAVSYTHLDVYKRQAHRRCAG